MKYFLLFLMIVCSGAFSHELTDDEIMDAMVDIREKDGSSCGYSVDEGEFQCDGHWWTESGTRDNLTLWKIKTIEGECTSREEITYFAENGRILRFGSPMRGDFKSFRHTHQVHEHDYTKIIPEDTQIRVETLQLYSHIFEEDLDNKIRELSSQAGGPEYIDLTLLKPKASFTKPHRVQLMREVNESKENIEMPELLRVIESLEQKVVDRTLSYFAIDPTIVDYFSYDECSNYLGVEAYERIKQEWRQPQDRWWFNREIKPLLEDMIMVGDLYHGDYVPY